MSVKCVCGFSLEDARSHGIWTLAEVACEYRTCKHCSSTRPFSPDDITGIKVTVVCEVHSQHLGCTRDWDREYQGLLDALDHPPPCSKALIMRGGVVLAKTYAGIDDVHGWIVQPPTTEAR